MKPINPLYMTVNKAKTYLQTHSFSILGFWELIYVFFKPMETTHIIMVLIKKITQTCVGLILATWGYHWVEKRSNRIARRPERLRAQAFMS